MDKVIYKNEKGNMMKTTLMKVDIDDFSLTIADGSKYQIEPSDITICCIWLPITEIEIMIVNRQKLCKNLSNGEIVRLSS